MALDGAALARDIKNYVDSKGQKGTYAGVDGLGREIWKYGDRNVHINTTGKASPAVVRQQRLQFESWKRREEKTKRSQSAVALRQKQLVHQEAHNTSNSVPSTGNKLDDALRNVIALAKPKITTDQVQDETEEPPKDFVAEPGVDLVDNPPENAEGGEDPEIEDSWWNQHAHQEQALFGVRDPSAPIPEGRKRRFRVSVAQRTEAAYAIMLKDPSRIWPLFELIRELPPDLLKGQALQTIAGSLRRGFADNQKKYDVEIFKEGAHPFIKLNWRAGDDFVGSGRRPIIRPEEPEPPHESVVGPIPQVTNAPTQEKTSPPGGLPEDLLTEISTAIDSGSVAKAWVVLGRIVEWHQQLAKPSA